MAEPRDHDSDLDLAIDEAVRAWHQDDAAAMTTHPEPDALVDYQEGRLGDAETEEIRLHLVRCADCRNELLLLDGFDRGPADDATRPTEEDTDRAWQRFREARDAARADRARGVPTSTPHPAAAPRWSWPLRLAAAAALTVLAVSVFLLGRWSSTDRTVAAIARGAPFVFNLEPAGSTIVRGVEGSAQAIEIPAGTDVLVPRLSLGDLTRYERYWIELHDIDGAVDRRPGVREPSGRISFLVPRAAWPDGETTIRLVARSDDGDIALATYEVRLRFAP